MKRLLTLCMILALAGCGPTDKESELVQKRVPRIDGLALTEDGRYIRMYDGSPAELCLDGFIAIAYSGQSWWRLDQETRMPMRCKPLAK